LKEKRPHPNPSPKEKRPHPNPSPKEKELEETSEVGISLVLVIAQKKYLF
jgi:hypothetical protein